MAQKVIAVKLTLDAGQSVDELEKVENGLKDVDTALGNISNDDKAIEDTFKNLKKQVDSGTMSIKQMGKAVKDYQTIAIQAGTTSPIGKQALAEAAALTDEIGDLKNQVNTLAHDGKNLQAAMQLGSTVIGGYSAFQSVIALVGVENENVTKTLVKLQAATSLLTAVEQIRANFEKESFMRTQAANLAKKVQIGLEYAYAAAVGSTTGVLKLFRLALISTGIGAIIVGIGLLIANFDALSKWVKDTADKFLNLKNVLLILAGPIGWIALAMGELEENTESARDAMIRQNEEAEKAHKKRVEELKSERTLQEEKLEDLEAMSKRQTEMNDLEILQAKARGASEREIFEITKRQNEENLKLAAEELAAKMKIIEINHQIAEAEYNRWKLFLQTQATMSGWTEEQAKRDLQRLEDAKAQYLEDEQAQIESSKNAFATMEAENELFLRSRDKQNAEAAKKEQERLKKELEEKQKLQAEYARAVYDMTIENMDDSWEKRRMILEQQHRDEQLDVIRRYGENTELEKLLLEQQQKEILALEEEFHQAEFDALEASIDAENALKEAEAEREAAEFQAKLDQAQGYIDAANMALETMGAINDLLNQLGENRIAKNEANRDKELASMDKMQKAELAKEGLTATEKAKIEQRYAMAEYKIKVATAEANDKIAKRQFNRNKAMQLGAAAMDTASAVLKAIATFGPPPSPMGIAAIVSAGVIGAANIAKIASAKFEGTAGSISPPDISIPDMGGENAGGGTQANNQVGNPNGNDQTFTAPLLNQNLQVSIVEVEKVAKSVKEIENISTIG